MGNDPLTIYDLNGMWWGGDAWGWLEEKASDVVDFTHRPEFALFTGYIPPEKRPFGDNQYVQLLNDPAIQLGLASGIGIPGGEFGEAGTYSTGTKGFLEGSRAAEAGQTCNRISTVELQATINRINAGEKLPFRNDGATFWNREGLLPEKPLGYYKEYVHPTPFVNGPGAQRVVIGQSGEIFLLQITTSLLCK